MYQISKETAARYSCGVSVTLFEFYHMYLKQKQKADAFSMMGQKQPAQEFETESWIPDGIMWTQMSVPSLR